MKLSKLFAPTLRGEVAEADSANHRLLVKAGFIRQEAAGIYSYLPLGLIVLRKIEQLVREGMSELGSSEILMPILHPKAPWAQTGGWDNIDVLFKLKSRTGQEYALGQSEEEIVTPLVMSRVQSYRDLPISVYQIHWKYRDELRAKSGILRGREFFMKDMYSFHADQSDFDTYYQAVKAKYIELFKKMGLTAKVTEGSGGAFSEKISYEFEVLTEAGEDDILFCENCDFCVNAEIAKVKSGQECPRCQMSKLQAAKAAEVGNVFDLGQKYGQTFDLGFVDEKNQKQYPVIGCYGFGISRTMGVVVEKFNDDKGIIWPANLAPAKYHLVVLGEDQKVRQAADQLYDRLVKAGQTVLYDDRVESAGTKFTDADLIGIPTRLTVSTRTLETASVEVKPRSQTQAKHEPIKAFEGN